MGRDYYLVLQVTPRATQEEIHAAYRRRSREVHPDTGGKSCEPFIELQAAYAVLGNPARRAAYDQKAQSLPIHRREGRPGSSRPAAEPFRAFESARRVREFSLAEAFDTYAPSFEELFARLWSNFEPVMRPKGERLESLRVDVPLSSEEAWMGGSARVLVPARVRCRACGGHGHLGPYECWQCKGQGALLLEYPLDVPYPAELRSAYVVRMSLTDLGIENLYLTIRFRPVDHI